MLINNVNTTVETIQFINESVTTNTLTGRLLIGHNRNWRHIRAYELHWGRNEKTPIGTNSLIAEFSGENIGWKEQSSYVFRKPLVYTFADTLLPNKVSHVLVFALDEQNRKHLYASRNLVNEKHLLPPSATRLERNLAACSERLGQIPVELSSLWDPSRCRSEFLPWLAWALSVDIWFDNKDDPAEETSRRRDLLRKNASVHLHKGTRAAIQQVLNAFADVNFTLTEWWQQTPPGTPHTFKLDLLVNGNISGIAGAELNDKLRQAIDANIPVRSHYTFTISSTQTATLRMAALSKAVSYKRFSLAAVI